MAVTETTYFLQSYRFTEADSDVATQYRQQLAQRDLALAVGDAMFPHGSFVVQIQRQEQPGLYFGKNQMDSVDVQLRATVTPCNGEVAYRLRWLELRVKKMRAELCNLLDEAADASQGKADALAALAWVKERLTAPQE